MTRKDTNQSVHQHSDQQLLCNIKSDIHVDPEDNLQLATDVSLL